MNLIRATLASLLSTPLTIIPIFTYPTSVSQLPQIYSLSPVPIVFQHIASAFQSFQLGTGHPTLVSTWTRSFPMPTKNTSQTLLNTTKAKAWRPDGPTQGRCLWELHDVWRWNTVTDQAVILRENYFTRHPDTGKNIDWYTNCYFPLAKRWSEQVRKVSPDVIVFLEPLPNQVCCCTFFFHGVPYKLAIFV
jgi:hypothetical protein